MPQASWRQSGSGSASTPRRWRVNLAREEAGPSRDPTSGTVVSLLTIGFACSFPLLVSSGAGDRSDTPLAEGDCSGFPALSLPLSAGTSDLTLNHARRLQAIASDHCRMIQQQARKDNGALIEKESMSDCRSLRPESCSSRPGWGVGGEAHQCLIALPQASYFFHKEQPPGARTRCALETSC